MYRALPFFIAIVPSLMASVFLMCSGCASHTQAVRPRLNVQIVSQPVGAQIEVNGQYVGDAPLNIQIEASNEGRFWRDTVIKAYPKETGYIQIKAFNGQSKWAISDMVPSRLFFDTRNDPGAEFEKPLPPRSHKPKPAPLPNP
jgi:PEGA domain